MSIGKEKNDAQDNGHFTDRVIDQISKWSNKLSWFPKVGAFTGTVVSFGLSIAVGGVWSTHGISWISWTSLLLTLAILFLVLSLVCASVLTIRTEAEKRKRLAEKVTSQANLTEAIVPLLRSISRLVDLPKSEQRKKVSQTVAQVSQAKTMLFPENNDVRLVVFQVQQLEKIREKQLYPIDYYGRSGNVPKPFISTEAGRGKKAFEWLESGNPKSRFVADCAEENDPTWAGTGNGYRTYISVPIVSNGRALGMLTVDAPKPGDLDETDMPMLEVMAYALATVFVVCPN